MSLGTKMTVLAADVLPEDFTIKTGFRRVVSVEPVMTTTGRGKNRTTRLTQVLLHYVDDRSEYSYPDEEIVVYRK